jgi:hypothetical protein
MDKYIGTKLIEAKQMNLGDYNKYKGWTIPDNENPETEGYLVKYSDSYESWSPKDVFEYSYKKLNMKTDIPEMLQHDLITYDNTYISHDEELFNAPNNYLIHEKNSKSGYDILAGIHFQEGPVKVHGLNGIFMEDLLAIVIDRLYKFQKSEFKCRENAIVITKLEESLMWLRKRTLNRKTRGVQGTYKV